MLVSLACIWHDSSLNLHSSQAMLAYLQEVFNSDSGLSRSDDEASQEYLPGQVFVMAITELLEVLLASRYHWHRFLLKKRISD